MLVRSIRTYLAAARHFSAGASAAEKASTTCAVSKSTGGGGRDTLGKRLMSLVYPKRSAVIAISKWKEEGHSVRKYELNRIVRELRKLKRYKHALEVAFFCFSFSTKKNFLLCFLIKCSLIFY